jgi:hypothetical protein
MKTKLLRKIRNRFTIHLLGQYQASGAYYYSLEDAKVVDRVAKNTFYIHNMSYESSPFDDFITIVMFRLYPKWYQRIWLVRLLNARKIEVVRRKKFKEYLDELKYGNSPAHHRKKVLQ